MFFFQLLSDFVESIYAIGLTGTEVPLEIVVVLLLLSPILLVLIPGAFNRKVFLIFAGIMLLCRVIDPLMPTRGKLFTAGLGVSSFLLFLPGLIYVRSRNRDAAVSWQIGLGLAFAVALSILLRTVGYTLDFSTQNSWSQILGIVLAFACAYLIPTQIWPLPLDLMADAFGQKRNESDYGRIIFPVLGKGTVFVLLYFAFTTPTVMSRWTGESFLLTVSLSVIVLTSYVWFVSIKPSLLEGINYRVLLLVTFLFAICLSLTIYLNQETFTNEPGLYPLAERAVKPTNQILLIITLLSFPIILLDFNWLLGAVIKFKPSLRSLGLGFSVSSLFIILMIFSHVFTSAYDYIPLVGFVFRDKFWLVYMISALMLFVSLIATSRYYKLDQDERQLISTGAFYPIATLLLAVFTVAAVILSSASHEAPSTPSLLKVLTYNIRQGYSIDGQRNFDGQLAVIQELNPDLIGLQETDTSRISGGNADIVRYLADKLDMYSYYGPKTVNGTFGIALLSRFPIENPSTTYLYSEGEQVAVIEAQISLGDQLLTVFVNHLGNGGPMIQQDQFLSMVDEDHAIIAVGDFNFKMGSEQYRQTIEQLDDCWWLVWPDGTDRDGLFPADKVDHIFVSTGLNVIGAKYIDDPASDHPAITCTVEW